MSLFEVSHLSRSGLSDISFSLDPGELVCLSGPSGSGKTLLLRALADLDVSAGRVCLGAVSREQVPPAEWRRRVAYLPAESRWWAPLVGDHFPDAQPAMFSQLGFGEEVAGWRVERLSSGERQRLALARLLANEPEVLLLDEPTANLDPVNTGKVESIVRAWLQAHRAACLWVTHDQAQTARIADRVLVLDSHGLLEAAA
ncbi:MAG TPA: ATP-binding cassette domain-containing protein [Gammaproteobacteria bacterium]|nr:ATP-binding cassette domain-containing protein [Gammaproteobacteria bacterium]